MHIWETQTRWLNQLLSLGVREFKFARDFRDFVARCVLGLRKRGICLRAQLVSFPAREISYNEILQRYAVDIVTVAPNNIL